MSVEFSDLKEYRSVLQKSNVSFQKWISEFLLREGMRAIKLIKPRTPVDSGTLRRNWSLGKVTVAGDVVKVEIVNPTDYASFIEYGFVHKGGGKYPGAHMAEVSLSLIQQKLPSRFSKELKSWLEKNLGGE